MKSRCFPGGTRVQPLGTGTLEAQGVEYRFQLSLILARDGLEAMERLEFARALQLLETARSA